MPANIQSNIIINNVVVSTIKIVAYIINTFCSWARRREQKTYVGIALITLASNSEQEKQLITSKLDNLPHSELRQMFTNDLASRTCDGCDRRL